MQTSLTERSRN